MNHRIGYLSLSILLQIVVIIILKTNIKNLEKYALTYHAIK